MTIELTFQGQTAPCRQGETVLEALERVGASISSSCRAGACLCCLLRAVEGEVPKSSQEGLKQSLRQTGHFLACLCRPTTNMICEPAHSSPFRSHVIIAALRPIGPDVMLVRFHRPASFTFRPGQFVTLKLVNGVARSYSLASQDRELEFFDIHVRRVLHGRMSSWFHESARVGDSLWLEGPKGECMYYADSLDAPLTFIGTGTGVAPLYAIAVDAINQNHRGPMTIYQGATSPDRLYFCDELATLAALHSNIKYVRCVMQGSVIDEIRTGDLRQIVLSEIVKDKSHRAYLCGDPGLVRSLKKSLFLSGLSLKRIHADPFVLSPTGPS